jgi:spore coat polysaccharide biosynthesis predicted glycosyltransferase SpsG
VHEFVLILTECGVDIGFGHLTRCLSLADAFRNAGMNAEVWVVADASLAQSLPESVRPVQWYGIPDDLMAKAARAYGVLLDSFKIGADQIERIAAINRRIAVIDDAPRRRNSSGVVIDWTIGAEHFAFPARNSGALYLLGSQYCALRPEFKRIPKREFSDSPRSLLVTFGGSDPRSLTAPVVAMLHQEFPALQKLVVAGPGFSKTALEATYDRNTAFHTAVSGDLMQTLMARADIAICGGGQTLYELASQGLPPVITGIVEDQMEDIRGFTEAGFGIDVGSWQRPDLLEALAAGIRELWPASVRERHSVAGRRCVDGHGAERLATAVLAEWKRTVPHG